MKPHANLISFDWNFSFLLANGPAQRKNKKYTLRIRNGEKITNKPHKTSTLARTIKKIIASIAYIKRIITCVRGRERMSVYYCVCSKSFVHDEKGLVNCN